MFGITVMAKFRLLTAVVSGCLAKVPGVQYLKQRCERGCLNKTFDLKLDTNFMHLYDL